MGSHLGGNAALVRDAKLAHILKKCVMPGYSEVEAYVLSCMSYVPLSH